LRKTVPRGSRSKALSIFYLLLYLLRLPHYTCSVCQTSTPRCPFCLSHPPRVSKLSDPRLCWQASEQAAVNRLLTRLVWCLIVHQRILVSAKLSLPTSAVHVHPENRTAGPPDPLSTCPHRPNTLASQATCPHSNLGISTHGSPRSYIQSSSAIGTTLFSTLQPLRTASSLHDALVPSYSLGARPPGLPRCTPH
jgi:hypothetical protein